MGYRHQAKTFMLRFEDLPGLEVVMRSVSVGKLMDINALAEQAQSGTATAAQVAELFTLFAGRLISWNLEDDNGPVPADIEGVRTIDFDLFMMIFEGWFSGMGNPPKAKPSASANGSHPAEASLPMDALSPSLTR